MIWILLALLVKHFVADFPLQTAWMLGKSRREGWVGPLAAHCWVHAFLTAAILTVAGAGYLGLAIAAVEAVAHFGIDRIKAHPDLGGRWNPAQPQFWWALGADQLAHNLCYLAIAWMVTK